MDGLSVILGVTKSTIERNVLEPMRNIYGDELVGVISSDNTARIFGEKCYCLGAEKISQVSKLRGASFKYCYGDEVADWSEDVFALLKSRLEPRIIPVLTGHSTRSIPTTGSSSFWTAMPISSVRPILLTIILFCRKRLRRI